MSDEMIGMNFTVEGGGHADILVPASVVPEMIEAVQGAYDSWADDGGRTDEAESLISPLRPTTESWSSPSDWS